MPFCYQFRFFDGWRIFLCSFMRVKDIRSLSVFFRYLKIFHFKVNEIILFLDLHTKLFDSPSFLMSLFKLFLFVYSHSSSINWVSLLLPNFMSGSWVFKFRVISLAKWLWELCHFRYFCKRCSFIHSNLKWGLWCI